MRVNFARQFDPPFPVELLQRLTHKDCVLVERFDITPTRFCVLRQTHHQVAGSTATNHFNVVFSLVVPKVSVVAAILLQMRKLDLPNAFVRLAPILPDSQEHSPVLSHSAPKPPHHAQWSLYLQAHNSCGAGFYARARKRDKPHPVVVGRGKILLLVLDGVNWLNLEFPWVERRLEIPPSLYGRFDQVVHRFLEPVIQICDRSII